MSELEKKLTEAATKGEWAEFQDAVPTLGQTGVTIQASFIRKLLLGVHDLGSPRIQGVRLRGAIIRGVLDLSDCGGIDGEPLPPLLFHRCLILGDSNQPEIPVINGLHARLSRLSLKECRVGRVDLFDATIGGDLELDGIQPIDESRSCQISARQCQIDGWVSAKAARLRIPQGQTTADLGLPDFALHLAGAEIKGSILLQPGFYADGGVNVGGARVSGDIWGEGAELIASEYEAFRAQSLQCDGTVALRAVTLRGTKDELPSPCKIKGRIDFLDASVGFIDFRGIHILQPPKKFSDGNRRILTLSLSRVRNNIWLYKDEGRTSSETIVEGTIDARACTIGGDLDLSGLTVKLPDYALFQPTAFYASNLRVGGNLLFDDLTANIFLDGSHVEHDLKARNIGIAPNGKDYALWARNIVIGNNCELTDAGGIVNLELARIGGALTVNARWLSKLNAKDSEIRGAVLIQGSIKNHTEEYRRLVEEETIQFDGGRYGEFTIDIKLHQIWEDILSLSIQDARIERDLSVKKVLAAKPNETQHEVIQAILEKTPSEVSAVQLPFYGDWTLVEAVYQLNDGRKAILAFMRNEQDKEILLSGRSWFLHSTDLRSHLKLDSIQATLGYLRFYLAYVWDEEEASYIIEDKSVLGGAEISTPLKLSSALIEGSPEDGWSCNATLLQGTRLFETKLSVSRSGRVKFLEKKPLAELKGFIPVMFVSPVRIVAQQQTTDSLPADFLNLQLGPVVEPPADMRSAVARLHTQVMEQSQWDGQGAAKILLRGLKAGALRQRSDSWDASLQLELEGFEYDRIEFPARFEKRDEKKRLLRRPRLDRRRKVDPLEERIGWLRLQYTGSKEKADEFTPQPYEQLARVLRNSGHSEDAKRVTLQKLSLERQLIQPWWAKPFSWLMETFFQYGLFASRSVVLFFALWIGGAAAFELAYYGHFRPLSWPELSPSVMVVDSMPVNVIAPPAPIRVSASRTQSTDERAGGTVESPCGDEIDSLWYALDVFVPLLDLHQEERCTISSSDGSWLWRSFKSLYAVAGGIVTSMMLLSISGVLRRRVEQ